MLIRWRIALIPTLSNLSSFPHAVRCSGITHCTVKCLHDRRSRMILGILLVIRTVHRGLSAGIKDLWELSEPYEHLSTNMTHIPSADPHHTEQRVDLHTVWERIQKGSAAYTCYVVISKTPMSNISFGTLGQIALAGSVVFSSLFSTPQNLSIKSVDLGYARYQTDVSLAEGVTSFLGIRYAAPPTGQRSPREHKLSKD